MAETCSSCGVQLRDGSKFCPKCGTQRPGGERVVGGRMRMTESGEAAIAVGRSSIAPVKQRRSSKVRVAAHSVEPADFGQRLGALLFDMLIFMIVLMLATFLLSSFSQKSIVGSNLMLAAFYSVAGVLYVLNFVLLAGREGQTIGKRLVGIRVVTVDGEPVSYGTVLLRHCVGYLLSALAGFLGFLWAIWDSKHQTWHDKLARTVVVLAR